MKLHICYICIKDEMVNIGPLGLILRARTLLVVGEITTNTSRWSSTLHSVCGIHTVLHVPDCSSFTRAKYNKHIPLEEHTPLGQFYSCKVQQTHPAGGAHSTRCVVFIQCYTYLTVAVLLVQSTTNTSRWRSTLHSVCGIHKVVHVPDCSSFTRAKYNKHIPLEEHTPLGQFYSCKVQQTHPAGGAHSTRCVVFIQWYTYLTVAVLLVQSTTNTSRWRNLHSVCGIHTVVHVPDCSSFTRASTTNTSRWRSTLHSQFYSCKVQQTHPAGGAHSTRCVVFIQCYTYLTVAVLLVQSTTNTSRWRSTLHSQFYSCKVQQTHPAGGAHSTRCVVFIQCYTYLTVAVLLVQSTTNTSRWRSTLHSVCGIHTVVHVPDCSSFTRAKYNKHIPLESTLHSVCGIHTVLHVPDCSSFTRAKYNKHIPLEEHTPLGQFYSCKVQQTHPAGGAHSTRCVVFIQCYTYLTVAVLLVQSTTNTSRWRSTLHSVCGIHTVLHVPDCSSFTRAKYNKHIPLEEHTPLGVWYSYSVTRT
ncbi:hypothetical protein J6590_058946 [Homalodisca vitripennis]|nr:hypothetical protein J6590_058946 [Homalodisca vitripennis]